MVCTLRSQFPLPSWSAVRKKLKSDGGRIRCNVSDTRVKKKKDNKAIRFQYIISSFLLYSEHFPSTAGR